MSLEINQLKKGKQILQKSKSLKYQKMENMYKNNFFFAKLEQHYFYLILIEFTIFVLFFPFILKGDDNKTHKDIHHEESDHNDVEHEINGNPGSIILTWSIVDRG